MGGVYSSGGHIYNTHGGSIVWSTDRRPPNLLPASSWITKTGYAITWPDFVKDNAYALSKGEGTGGLTVTVCLSMATILPGEWGPLGAGVYYLAPDLLGTVPAGVNYLDVQATLTRTTTPSTWMGRDIRKDLPEGKTVQLVGGSARVENCGIFRRGFEVVLSGTNVYLNRRQSVRNNGNIGIWTPGNAIYEGGGGMMEGWTYGSRNDGHPAYVLQTKGPDGSQHQRGGSNACSLTDTSNYTSIWTGTILVRPGYLAP